MGDVEQSEVLIEQSLLEFEKGNIDLEQVQKTTNLTLHTKYKAELSAQDYKKEVESTNKFLAEFEDEYKPLLQRIQQDEESRINFLKYNFEKFLKHMSQLGRTLTEKSSEMQG